MTLRCRLDAVRRFDRLDPFGGLMGWGKGVSAGSGVVADKPALSWSRKPVSSLM